MGGARLGWQASLWGGPSCFDEARSGPEMFSLEALVVPFLGAQKRGDPYSCQGALQTAPER